MYAHAFICSREALFAPCVLLVYVSIPKGSLIVQATLYYCITKFNSDYYYGLQITINDEYFVIEIIFSDSLAYAKIKHKKIYVQY